MWKVGIVDDEPKIRRGFKKWVKEHKDFQCVFEALNATEALEKNKQEKADLFLLDIQMEGLTGLSLGKIIKKEHPEALVVYITGYDYFEYAHEAIKLQAFDFLLKPVPESDFNNLLDRVRKYLEKQYPKRKAKKNIPGDQPLEKTFGGCSKIVRQVQEHIERDYGNTDLSLEKVAATFTIHKDYLSKLMKEELGSGFVEYLTEIRIQRAKELLRQDTTNIRMYEVAEKAGYKSQHYFSRIFKTQTGYTPLEYRNKY
ncbi:response regulator transcription factor [Isachenkonia alkalipeptolytica]|uniref:Stage 0 sporulation protein A homolog n=1 Tax=Isachenkonia alkalipeptolytica TaxID=2565777 RepID=A0AA43XNC7_9CLOT|nr:response regulator [Isachenkonia alkalipeptolytica]NBG89349.1 response regulator [Isachenkonia alkalipeptolytica]